MSFRGSWLHGFCESMHHSLRFCLLVHAYFAVLSIETARCHNCGRKTVVYLYAHSRWGLKARSASPVQGIICPKRGPTIPRIGRYSKLYNMFNAVPGVDTFQSHFYPPDHSVHAWYLGSDRAMVVVHDELKPVGTVYILWLLPWWLNCLEAVLLQFGCIRWAFKLLERAVRQSTINRQRERTTSPRLHSFTGNKS